MCEKPQSVHLEETKQSFDYLKTTSGKKLHYFCSELVVVLIQKVVNL